MDWFKHATCSHDDPDISDAMDEFGLAGYAVFFITLEVYGREFNHLDSDGWLTLSSRYIARKLRQSSTKVQQILNFYSERQRIFVKVDGNSISIKCPKFIDIASNWVKRKKGEPTEGLQRDTVAPTAKEVEEEVEEEKDIYRCVFDFWNDQKIFVHERYGDKERAAIKSALKSRTEDQIYKAILNYGKVIHSDTHYFKHKWTLVDFLKRGLGKFLDEADPLSNYLKDKPSQQKKHGGFLADKWEVTQ